MCRSVSVLVFFFFFKQKKAYDMRISDWSSDVCSSDLIDTPMLRAGFEGNDAGYEQLRIFHPVKAIGSAYDLGVLAKTLIEMPSMFQIGRASCRERVCQYV